MRPSITPAWLGAFAAFAAYTMDQATKALVLANAASLENGIAIVPGFNLIFLRNSGVSFGMLGSLPWWALAFLTFAICAWLSLRMLRAPYRSEALAYGLIIGGALGNVTDRFRFGGVTDFLDFYVRRAHWPAFNLADTAIFFGAAILLLSAFRGTQGNDDAT